MSINAKFKRLGIVIIYTSEKPGIIHLNCQKMAKKVSKYVNDRLTWIFGVYETSVLFMWELIEIFWGVE
jgi:hypoxanthine-guanine phosphoribosyltransferase